MALNFPSNPGVGQEYTENNITYTWDGVKWASVGTGVSFQTDIYTLLNDDTNLVGATRTEAIVAALIAAGDIVTSAELSNGDQVFVNDSGNADFNVNVPPGSFIWDGSAWLQQPSATSPVTSVFGRAGNIVATEGDYTLDQLGGVTVPSPTAGQALIFNGTQWVASGALVTITTSDPIQTDGANNPTLSFSIAALDLLP